jgi:hypothetical protein
MPTDGPTADGPGSEGPEVRAVEVPLRRMDRWLAGFEGRHGPWTADLAAAPPPAWVLRAADSASAVVHLPPWLDSLHTAPTLGELVGMRPRFGVLLIRRAGYAVACFDGRESVERKVGSRHVHGRTAAGGWSQQRYARRRSNQADEIVGAAASAADRILGGGAEHSAASDFLVTGGDRPLLVAALERVSRAVADLPVRQHLAIGTPDAAVLAGVPDRVLAVRIEVTDG